MPFDICAESTTWVRPSPEVQAKLWNDPTYSGLTRDSYKWTHNFLVIDEPLSAVWVLLHRVTEVRHDANTYTVIVEPTGKGFQFVFIHRLNPKAVVRFVTPDGKELERWDESAPLRQFNNAVPPVRASSGRMG